ncbi:MAG: rhodanese-like domain-containing protein [Phaeodactylibacter sp.]|uniref:rhodanese-like domain-containing protein n=1 Tax=Phaeodactylibacter sp. TaxID=1940289 RepID=UPI0032EC308C
MRFFSIVIGVLMLGRPACAQPPEDRPPVGNPRFDQKISSMLSFTIPTIGVQEVRDIQEEVYIFDARNREEYNVSHIEGARFLGYKNLEEQALEGVPKDSQVVLYCSIGYRSEKVAEQLRKRGFTNVHNLYGSIFEWVNQGLPVVDTTGEQTNKVHTYNANWGKWVDKKQAEKVW